MALRRAASFGGPLKIVGRRTGVYDKAGEEYVRHDVTIPAAAMRDLDWHANDELDWHVHDGRLCLGRKHKTRKKED